VQGKLQLRHRRPRDENNVYKLGVYTKLHTEPEQENTSPPQEYEPPRKQIS